MFQGNHQLCLPEPVLSLLLIIVWLYLLSPFLMSVIILSPRELGNIATSLRVARGHFGQPIFPLSPEERLDYQLLRSGCEQSLEEYTRSLVNPFVYRLYLANALAEAYTYMQSEDEAISLPLIDIPDGIPLSLLGLLKSLSKLSYNIITNGGNSFLGTKDGTKLDTIMGNLQRDLAESICG